MNEAELKKQIISATWKLQRDQNAVRSTRREAGSRIGESVKPAENSAAPTKKVGTRRIVPEFIGAFHGRRSFGGGLPQFMGQRAGVDTLPAADPPKRAPAAGPAPTPKYEDDAGVVRDSQAQVLEQAKATLERQQDPRAAALWSRAIKDMEDALARLERVANSPALLAEALLAEQAAYQALLKLQEHEYQVSRARSQSKGQQSSSQQQQQMQRQLDQLELSQSENRYETQRQAQSPQSQERKEQLQVQNRLQELARRQQDLNDRLKELQTALQEAKTEQERAEIQRRLKRLQEDEQQMLADVDDLRHAGRLCHSGRERPGGGLSDQCRRGAGSDVRGIRQLRDDEYGSAAFIDSEQQYLERGNLGSQPDVGKPRGSTFLDGPRQLDQRCGR